MSNPREAEAAREQVATILTAVGKPMSREEIFEHQMFKPVATTNRSLAQYLKYMVKTKQVRRQGSGKKATYSMPVPVSAREASQPKQVGVILRLKRTGEFHSVQATGPVTIEMVD